MNRGNGVDPDAANRVSPVVGDQAVADDDGVGHDQDDSYVADGDGFLDEHHKQLLIESSIKPLVARQRGYRTVNTKAALERLGFGKNQRNVPALLIPQYNVDGDLAGYVIRPDEPRVSDGKPAKYETPHKQRNCVDVHPRLVRGLHYNRLPTANHGYEASIIANPKVPLLITEGIRKADAGISADLCTVSINGVWGWYGRNAAGGTTALPDWRSFALKGREVYLVFDSDAMVKPGVHKALEEFVAFLTSKGASVYIIYLPARENGKNGLDDWIADQRADGADNAEIRRRLFALASPELKPLPKGNPPRNSAGAAEAEDGESQQEETYFLDDNPYVEAGGVICRSGIDPETGWPKPSPIASFTGRITTTLIRDDGVEAREAHELVLTRGEESRTVTIPGDKFNKYSAGTYFTRAGVGYTAYPGKIEEVLFALKKFSNPVVRYIYTYTGWRQLANGVWVYLHGGLSDVELDLPERLRPCSLPPPLKGEELKAAAAAELALFHLAPTRISFPIFCLPALAPLGLRTAYSTALWGPTGVHKTTLGLLVQQHFGVNFNEQWLPDSFNTTELGLLNTGFAGKDMVVLYDEWLYEGSQTQKAAQLKVLNTLVRGVASGGNRGGMKRDGLTRRPERPPRCLPLITMERLPPARETTDSLQARLAIIYVGPNDIPITTELSDAQAAARKGVFAAFESAYIAWIQANFETIRERADARRQELRDSFRKEHLAANMHDRVAIHFGYQMTALEYWFNFMHDIGVLSDSHQRELLDQGREGHIEAARLQTSGRREFDMLEHTLQAIESAVSVGRAHFARQKDGGEPVFKLPNRIVDLREALGWHERQVRVGEMIKPVWDRGGDCIGWVDVDRSGAVHLYLDDVAALKVAELMSKEVLSNQTELARQLHERGLLVDTDLEHGETYKVHRTCSGKNPRVLYIKETALFPKSINAEGKRTGHGLDTGPLQREATYKPKRKAEPDEINAALDAAAMDDEEERK